jgi:hypothetical protein
MNYIIKNNKEYILIGFFNKNHNDSHNKKFSIPKDEKKWNNRKTFIEKLNIINSYLLLNNKFKSYITKKDCLLCDKKNISTKKFYYKNYIWEDGLIHYIEAHNFHPDESFLDLIYLFKIHKLNKRSNINTDIIDNKFIKININQLLILDSLMAHGGYTKKYIDLKNRNLFRYSEHYGILYFKNHILEKIIVAGNTTRVDTGDNEIFLPKDLSDYLSYEYIFHTHPPTPKPGGRVYGGVLYEIPSIGDILHFIDSFNMGNICGSIVITSEGLYNIRKTVMNRDKFIINENKLFLDYKKVFNMIQTKAINKYSTEFTLNEFYTEIAQDTSFIDQLNKMLSEYMLKIDYYPRIKISKQWVLNQIYLPIF